MNPRLIAAILFAASACEKTDTATQTPEPAPADTQEATPDEAVAEETAPEEPAAKPPPAEAPAGKNLVAVVAGLENGKTFAELLAACELDKDLQSPDVSLTLLVPSDAAFAKLPKGTIDKWKKNKDQLQKVLKFHFIPGINNAAKIGNYRTAPTAAGPELPVKTTQDSDMTIGGGRLTDIDIEATNGIVHMIDKVLQPSAKK